MFLEIGVEWSEMQAFLSKRKKDIVKWLLVAVKSDNTVYVKSIVERMMQLNVDWPELAIILKSATTDLNNLSKLDEGDMSLNELDDLMRIEQNFNKNEIYYALMLIAKNKFTVVDHPDIGYLLDDQQERIKEFMLYRLERKDVFEFIRIVGMLKSTRIGWTWPTELAEQRKHDVVKLLLSLRINPYSDPELLLDLAWILKKNGISWPELDTIERSVRSDSRQINESDDEYDDQSDPLYNTIYELFDSPNFMDVFDLPYIYDVERLQQNPEIKTLFYENMQAIGEEVAKSIIDEQSVIVLNKVVNGLIAFGIELPNRDLQATLKPYTKDIKNILVSLFIDSGPSSTMYIKQACDSLKQLGMNIDSEKVVDFNANKATIITFLLQTIKNTEYQEDVISYIDSLRQIGADWPELSIIEKSVRSDINQNDS